MEAANLTDMNTIQNYILTGERGFRAEISSYGAKILRLEVPNDKGEIADVVLGFNTMEELESVSILNTDSEDDVYYQNAVEDGEVDDSEETDTVVVFPESDVDAGGQHFADEAEENM